MSDVVKYFLESDPRFQSPDGVRTAECSVKIGQNEIAVDNAYIQKLSLVLADDRFSRYAADPERKSIVAARVTLFAIENGLIESLKTLEKNPKRVLVEWQEDFSAADERPADVLNLGDGYGSLAEKPEPLFSERMSLKHLSLEKAAVPVTILTMGAISLGQDDLGSRQWLSSSLRKETQPFIVTGNGKIVDAPRDDVMEDGENEARDLSSAISILDEIMSEASLVDFGASDQKSGEKGFKGPGVGAESAVAAERTSLSKFVLDDKQEFQEQLNAQERERFLSVKGETKEFNGAEKLGKVIEAMLGSNDFIDIVESRILVNKRKRYVLQNRRRLFKKK